jgi:hypothetical protein
MEYPEEFELMSLFECEPIISDNGTPFYYRDSTYNYTNNNGENFICIIYPAVGEVKIQVTKGTISIGKFHLETAKSFTILEDNKSSKRIMLIGENYDLKLTLYPQFEIEFTEKLDR